MNPYRIYPKNNKSIIRLPTNDLLDDTGLVLGTGKKENKSKFLSILFALDGCFI